MYELKVKNKAGEVFNFSTTPNYTIYKITGLEPPVALINTSNNATTDGAKVNSVRVDKRNLVLYITVEGDIEANRIKLYSIFPLKRRVTLYYKNGSRDVYIEGVVESVTPDFFANKQMAQVSIICPQPYFKDIDELVTHFSEITSLFEFPFSIGSSGTEISAITNNVRKSIINTGEVESGIIIKLYAAGTVEKPIIYDVFKRKHIGLNFTMLANDEIVINTYKGEKSISLIRSGITSNIMGYMTPDSKWLTLDIGDNVFTYDCASGISNLQLTFTTALLYGGV